MSQPYRERPHYPEVVDIIEDALIDAEFQSRFRQADKVFEKLFEAGYLR